MIVKVEYQIWQAVYLVSSHALWRPDTITGIFFLRLIDIADAFNLD